MKLSRFAAVLVAAGAVAGILSSGCAKKKEVSAHAFPDSILADEVVAKVNSEDVLGSDVMVLAYTTTAATPDSLHNPDFNKRVLDQMIDRVVFSQEAVAAGVTVADTLVANMLNQFVEQFGGDERVTNMLTEMGLKREDISRSFRRDMVIRSYVQTVVEPSISVDEADSRAYYAQHEASFAAVDSVHARHIILMFRPDDTDETRAARRELINSIHKRAAGGEDFGRLAMQYSQDGAANNGGDLGYFARGMMVKAFEDVAFSLKKGQISNVVETQFGLHLVQVIDRKNAHPVTFEEVRPRVEQILRQQTLGSELQNRLKRNRDAAIIVRTYEAGA
ncbi:MAG TPA: peptidylprolyl isomerase [Candidatus Krumholzibacteria bacterium]|nr:peptidylprolyl isomerase [Candidatus Krumholzibacteria bacterium]